MMHRGGRPLSCNVDGESCKKKATHQIHKYIHMYERNFLCHIC